MADEKILVGDSAAGEGVMARVRDRLIEWLAVKANNYLIWAFERDLAGAPICPDCDQPEPVCYCSEKATQDEIMQSAYDSGYDAGCEARR